MRLVVDASVALDWCFSSERTEQANRALERVVEEGAFVPAIWPAEVANGLISAHRSGRLSGLELAEALSLFRPLRIDVDHQGRKAYVEKLIVLGTKYGLTSYDASYLELALRVRLPLATHDKPLKTAARKAGVRLFLKGA